MDDKAKRYARIRYTFAVIDTAYFLILLSAFQLSGLAIRLRSILSDIFPNPAFLAIFYCLAMSILYLVLNFPFTFYRSYVVEHKFDLSKQRLSSWASDFIKANILSFIFFAIVIEVMLYFVTYHPKDWWWLGGTFWIFLSVILARMFPVLIIPLFFKYKRMDNEDLRQRIFALSGKMGIKVLDIYQIDFSRKSLKANAAMVGLGKSKRVILTDTLEGRFSPDEIEVILAHEFAHFRLKHLVKLVILSSAATFLIF